MALYQGQLMQGMGGELGVTTVKLSGVCTEREELRETIMAKLNQLSQDLSQMYYGTRRLETFSYLTNTATSTRTKVEKKFFTDGGKSLFIKKLYPCLHTFRSI